MIRRCKWCIDRIGSARLFLEDEWRIAVPRQGEAITDGICPDCFAAETAKIEAMPPRRNFGLVASLVLLATTIACRGIDAPRLANAIKQAEGNRHPYGVLSVKVKDDADARRICLNSIRNNQKRFGNVSDAEFIRQMADRWCPISADPTGNKNWKRNVSALYFRPKK